MKFLKDRKKIVVLINLLIGCGFFLLPGQAILGKFIFMLLFSFIGSFTGLYVFEVGKENFIKENRYCLLIVLILLMLYFPFLICGYYFHDDYWAFAGNYGTSKAGIYIGLIYSRIIQGISMSVYDFVTPATIPLIRMMVLFCIIAFALTLYKWIRDNGGNPLVAFLISMIISCASITVDCIGYASIMTFILSVVLFQESVIFFDKISEYTSKVTKIFIGIFTIFMIVIALNAYQLGLPIVFFMFICKYVYIDDVCKKQWMIKFASYIGVLGIGCCVYFIVNKCLASLLGLVQSNRGTFIGISDVPNKIKWFFSSILPMACKRIFLCLGGRNLSKEKNYWSVVSYYNISDTVVKLLIAAFIGIILFTWIYHYLKHKRISDVFIFMISIPASYCICLVLTENTYMTYYAYPLIIMLAFFFVYGISIFLKNVKITYFILIFILGICCVQSSIYINQFWIGENARVSNTIKNEILVSDDGCKRIHVYGVPTIGEPQVYSKWAVNIMLKELKKDISQYTITGSDNEILATSIEKEIFVDGYEKLSEDEKSIINEYYIFDEIYKYYSINNFVNWNDVQTQEKCSMLLQKMGVLPASDEDCIIIDLRGVNAVWD